MTVASQAVEARGATEDRTRETFLAVAARTLAYAITGAVVAWPISVIDGVVAGALGAAIGSLAGSRLSRSQLRTPVLLAAAMIAYGVLLGAHDLVVGSAALARTLGPAGALRLGEAIFYGAGSLLVGGAIRLAAIRWIALGALEASTVALAFAALVVAHRNGAIHRPYEIADPLLSMGADPTIALLLIGTAAGGVIALLLLSERSAARWVLHLGAVAVLLLSVLTTTRMAGPPSPPPQNDGLNLRDDPERNSRGRGGGAGGPDFQDEYDQQGGQAPVALVLLHDDYSPPSGVYYFRQEAFSQYNGRRLVSASMSGVDRDTVGNFPNRVLTIADAPSVGVWRTSAETTVGMLADHPRPFGLESPVELTPLVNPDPARFRRTYRVLSAVLTSDEWGMLGRDAGDPSWTDEIRAHYTRHPDDPRYRALAERLIAELPDDLRNDPLAQAISITNYLSENGIYSLRSRHAGAGDPTAHFLFGDLTGYCVHFAHATTYLMRSVGLPARVATGYMVAESSRRGGSAILISGQNSHAWPEIYLQGIGWVVVDVAPQQSLDPPPALADEQLQQLLAEMLRGLPPLAADGSEPSRPIDEVVRDLRSGALSIALALAIVILTLGYGIKGWRRLAPLFATGRARARLLYRATLDVLSEEGLVREWGESREAFAARMRGSIPSLLPLTASHAAHHWGGRVADDAWKEMAEVAGRVRREAARQVPWWRRALGLINPFSWVLTR